MVNASIMQAMALDDSEFGVLFDKDEGNKENQPLSSSSRRAGPLGEKPLQQAGGGNGGGKQGREGAGEATVSTEPGQWFWLIPRPSQCRGRVWARGGWTRSCAQLKYQIVELAKESLPIDLL